MSTSHAMAHADAAWLHMDRPTNLMMITSALWFDEPLGEDALRRIIQERLVEPYPRFRQRVVEGRTGSHWEDDDEFDLDLHVHHLALPAPGDRAVLERVVGELMTEPLDRARPLWSIHLFDGYGEGSAMVVRMHHAIADGIALARVMLGLTDDEAAAEAHVDITDPLQPSVRLPFEKTARELAGLAGTAGHHAVESVLHPEHVAELAREGRTDAGMVAELVFAPGEPENPLHGPLGRIKHAAWSRPIALDAIASVAHAHDATINDVLVACVAGALRGHLLSQAVPPRSVHAMVPFNLRPLDEPLPRDLGNHFGLLMLELPVEAADPIERVRRAHERMSEIKESRRGAVSYGILAAIGRTPAALESRLVDFFSSKATLTMTNVPGPRTTVHLAGVPVAGVLVWAPASGAIGMSISVFSYAGTVRVGYMVNGALIEDPTVLVDGFEAGLEELGALS